MSVVKDVNVNGRTAADTKLLIDYLIDGLKTGGGKYIDGLGFITDNYLDEIQAVKRVHQKTGGRQFRQITIAPSPAENSCSDGDYVIIGRKIAEYHYNRGFQALVTVHLDSDTRHIHIMLNSVDFKTGRMFSQSRSELNRFKLHCNRVFAEYGLDQIRKPAETLTDTTVHELCDGFDCLELFDEVMADKASALADLFARRDTITRRDLSFALGNILSPHRLSDLLATLVKEGRLHREGTGSQTCYLKAKTFYSSSAIHLIE